MNAIKMQFDINCSRWNPSSSLIDKLDQVRNNDVYSYSKWEENESENNMETNTKLNEEIMSVWNRLNPRDDGMGCEFVEELPVEIFGDIAEYFYNLALNEIKQEIEKQYIYWDGVVISNATPNAVASKNRIKEILDIINKHKIIRSE